MTRSPNLADPIFISKLVLEDARGRVATASLARLTCKVYLLVDRAEGGADAGAHGGTHGQGILVREIEPSPAKLPQPQNSAQCESEPLAIERRITALARS